jgi:uncharacterized protein (TIGR02453 family)
MLSSSVFKFLKDLGKHNDKAWFDANRKTYESVKADFTQTVEQLIAGIASFDEPIGELEAKKCMFRINRDVRFSKDKSPYKTNIGAYFNVGGKKIQNAGYYFHCEPGRSFVAGGLWVPMAPELSKVRQEIDYNFAEWKKIVGNAGFKKFFSEAFIKVESLSRPPKGYDENNPAITYLKMKSFIVSRSFTDAELQDKKTIKEIVKTFSVMKPMLDFLNEAIKQ